MNVITLHPTDITLARDTIIEKIKENPVFVVTAEHQELFDYIPKLELKEKIQSRMCICKEQKINVLLKRNKKSEKFTLLSELLKAIEPDKEECEVVVLGDVNVSDKQEMEVRYQLCGIIQQFIYMNIQLSKVHVCTEKEAQDNAKIRAFEKSIDKHKKAILKSVERVNALSEDNKHHRTTILERLEKIQGYIDETQDNELKIAVAATKKSGKSVIVNSMIECEIAPTSLELATPNNCIYRKSSDDEFHLKYKGKGYRYKDSELIRSMLNDLFIEAGNDYERGLGIPDMELWYPSTKNGFSSYTIYDTPGPNLANATAHKEAAQRGIDAADVIVFTIDYSKYLTDDEYEYLKNVWRMCQEKGKKYSLILNVNKLDLRYEDGSDKSIVRIVDFIRNKLISTGEKDGIDFRNCVVIGTSALTYFNALVSPTLKCPLPDGDCRCLLKDFSDKAMKKCILSYDDEGENISVDYEKRAVSALQQLRGMIDNAEVWHKQNICSIQEMQEFSGMPNLLSYVEYISTQKARNEKVNNLLFKIDSEYRAIMNLFHIEELMQKLKENKELLAKAIKILNDFQESVNEVLDKDYRDLFYEYANNIYTNYENMQSAYMIELTKKYPIKLSEIGKMYSEQLDKQLGLNVVLEEVTGQQVETLLTRRLRKAYGNDDSKILKIDYVCDDYVKKLSDVSKNAMSNYVLERKEEIKQNLEKEQKAISATIAFIWQMRLSKLREIVKRYSDKLVEECSQQLNIEIPEFQINLGGGDCGADINFTNLNINEINEIIESTMRNLSRFNEGATTGIIGFFRKLFGAKNEITLGNVLKVYSSSKLAYDLKCVYEKNGNLKKYLDYSVSQLMEFMNEFLYLMDSEIGQLNNNIKSVTFQIKESIDESKKYQQNVEKLEAEKQALTVLKSAVSDFSASWNEVMTI